MPFFQDLTTKIKTLAAGIADFFKGLTAKPAGLGAKLLENIPEKKRRLFFIGIGGACAVLLLACAGVLLLTKKPGAPSSEKRVSVQRIVIPPEELFLPEEPDFIPGVLLERERRTVWTAEDAAPYWQDPLKNGEEQWRNRIEKAVDEFLEQVP
jgi:hypothetical protein